MRRDWTPAHLLRAYGRISWSSCNPPGRILTVTLWLPWPANKLPVLLPHLESLGIKYHQREYRGWTRDRHGKKRGRPQAFVMIRGSHALRFFESIGWECGLERKNQAMKVWKRWSERPRLERKALGI